jgi:hypothetical protein
MNYDECAAYMAKASAKRIQRLAEIKAEPQNSFQQYAAIVERIERRSQVIFESMEWDMAIALTEYRDWLTCNDLKERKSDVPQTVAWTLQIIRHQEMRKYQETKS